MRQRFFTKYKCIVNKYKSVFNDFEYCLMMQNGFGKFCDLGGDPIPLLD